MTDLALLPNEDGDLDISITDRDLTLSTGLQEAIIISLLTDARASDDDKLPTYDDDKRGWWGDAFSGDIIGIPRPIGSKLWLLSRSKITPEIITRAKGYINDALKWMLEDEIAKAINVAATIYDSNTIAFEIDIIRPDGETFNYKNLWSTIDGLAA